MTIGKFSEITGVPCSSLRYYEDKGLIRVKRDAANRRDYSESDTEWIKFLQKLKNTGMNLKDMKRYSNLRYEGDSTIAERLDLLQKHKIYVNEQLEKWLEYSKNLDNKIEWYKNNLS